MNAQSDTDFLITGAGVVGLTSALALLQQGYRVTLVERGSVGQEASWAGGGILAPLCSWDYPEAVTRLAHRSMGMFDEASFMLTASTGIDTEYLHSGMLVLPPFPQQQALQWCKQHLFDCELVELGQYLPAQQGSGLLLPEVSQVRNPRLLRALRERVELFGGVILERHEVQKLEVAGGRVIALSTEHGRLHADNYIVTAGAWSKVLLGEHALGLQVYPVRGQMLLFEFDAPPFQHILVQGGLYFIPRSDGHVLVGSTLEQAGFDKSTTDEARANLLRHVHAIFPAWQNRQPIRHWAGLRPGAPDNIPTIGRHPQLVNLYANCGHFRYGVTMSLASAELLLNEIEGNAQPIPVEAYRWRP